MSDEKRPFIAGAKRHKGVEVKARAEVLKIMALEIQAAVPPELVAEVVKLYLTPGMGGAEGVRALVGGMFRGAFGDSRLPVVLRVIRGVL